MRIDVSNYVELGRAIREERERRGISQRIISIRTGIAQKTISRFENGIDSPKYETVIRLIETLGLKLELVIEDEEIESEKPPGG